MGSSKDSVQYIKSMPVKCFSAFAVLSFTFASIANSFSVFLKNKNKLTISPGRTLKMDVIFTILTISFWVFGILFLYIFLIIRLRTVYIGSAYQISNKLQLILFGTLSLLFLLTIIEITWLTGVYHENYLVVNENMHRLFQIDEYMKWSTIILLSA